LCSSLGPKEALSLLNEFHSRMTQAISSEGGIVNQLVGDGIMALFGATEDTKGHAEKAIAAARAMLAEMPSFNESIKHLDHGRLQIGIGINTGRAIVGTIGSPGRMEFTAVGDVVNVAARIESLTKALKSPLLFSSSTKAKLGKNSEIVEDLFPAANTGESFYLLREDGLISNWCSMRFRASRRAKTKIDSKRLSKVSRSCPTTKQTRPKTSRRCAD
ncbi:MAG: adenylate/guanylate cyclase domain-containing protein, partial [Verrucomicrobiota bacterium]